MDTKTKNMLGKMHNMVQQCDTAPKSLLQKGKDMLNKLNYKNLRSPMMAAGTLGLAVAAGLTYYLVKNKVA